MRTLYAFLVSLALASSAVVADQLPLPFRLRLSTAADVTAPTVTITSPTSSATYDNGSTSTIDLSGTATDAVSVSSCTVTNAATGVSTGTIGAASWSVTGVQLASGSNAITVACIDTSNNSGNDVITVTYTPAVSGGNNCNGTCLAEVSFTTAQGWTSDRMQIASSSNSNVCTGPGFDSQHTGPGVVSRSGDAIGSYSRTNGGTDGCGKINAAANYSGGAGGRGYQLAYGDGRNQNDGGIKISWTATTKTNISVCYRKYYPTTFYWSASNPNYTKDIYSYDNTGKFEYIFGIQSGAYAIQHPIGSTNTTSSVNWSNIQGPTNGDGQWHEYAFFIDTLTRVASIWIDDVQYMTNKAIPSGGSNEMLPFFLLSNYAYVDNDQDGISEGDETSVPPQHPFMDDFVIDEDVTNGGKLEC